MLSWPSGVQEFPKRKKSPLNNTCVYYIKGKGKEIDKNILALLNKFSLSHTIFVYGTYTLDDFIQALKESDFAIFDTGTESQGIALAEAWMQNVPTLVKIVHQEPFSSAPYLCPENGLFFDTMEDLENILKKYKQNPQNFLAQFEPYEYVSREMTDKSSVKKLLKLFE